MLFARRAKEEGKLSNIYISIKTDEEGITSDMVEEMGGVIPFARARDLEKWSVWIRRKQVKAVNLICESEDEVFAEKAFDMETIGIIIPITFSRNSEIQPLGHLTKLKRKDQISCLVHFRKMEQFEKWLGQSIFKQNVKKNDN